MAIANFDFLGLFFLLGVVASYFKSDLKFHEAGVSFLSAFLLLSIGLKGGHSFSALNDYNVFFKAAGLGLASTLLIPIIFFFLLRNVLGPLNAAALAACYGSVSVVTFIAATNYLSSNNISYSEYNTALLAIMEIPAILIGIYLGMRLASEKEKKKSSQIVKSLLSSKSFVLLVGGFFIGNLMNQQTWQSLSPLFVDSFKGILALYLLDLGMRAQQRFNEVNRSYFLYAAVSILLPVIFATFFVFLGLKAGLGIGNSAILGTLVASSSYIAAPACISVALPKANPGIYVSLPLAVTFTFNIFVGIPLYLNVAKYFANT